MLDLVHRKIAFGLGALGIVGLLIACTEDAQRPDLPATLGNPEPIEIVGSDGTSHAALSANGGCEDVGALTAEQLTVKFIETGLESTTFSATDRPQPAKLTILASGDAAQLAGTTVNLAEGRNTNFQTCSHCFVVAIGCGADCSKAAFFYPRSGTATFTKVAGGTGGSFEGRLENAELEQVTVDATTQVSTKVAKGACMRVPLITFSAKAVASPDKTGPGGTKSTPVPTTLPVPSTPPTSPALPPVDPDPDHGGGGGGGGKTKANELL